MKPDCLSWPVAPLRMMGLAACNSMCFFSNNISFIPMAKPASVECVCGDCIPEKCLRSIALRGHRLIVLQNVLQVSAPGKAGFVGEIFQDVHP